MHASLIAATDEARAALGGAPSIAITTFPFKIGLEARSPARAPQDEAGADRRRGSVPPLNDVFLIARQSEPQQISRQHCAIVRVENGYYLVDTTSTLGTVVVRGEDRESATLTQVGGGSECRAFELDGGDLIVVGSAESPYVFRFDLGPAPG